ncbi:hypothetical protein OH76DRAFT_1424289 [Lentinus brumalis]|uniref:Uncharacterized protein n=1 Tax=Lentinus brumalis TaxID=2498619 RepID=A0A371CGV5_9APHY|nr:hypothetical protein OH76DRAFT_1424289 [Polyporus brumalis]
MSIVGPPMDPHREGTPSSLPPGAAAPHLLGMRAETGSIFREAVWPPPGQPSALVDPLVKASSAVDLSRIVDDRGRLSAARWLCGDLVSRADSRSASTGYFHGGAAPGTAAEGSCSRLPRFVLPALERNQWSSYLSRATTGAHTRHVLVLESSGRAGERVTATGSSATTPWQTPDNPRELDDSESASVAAHVCDSVATNKFVH